MTVETYTWSEARDKAIELFGETPNPGTEQEIIHAFEEHPRMVITTIEAVAERKRAGKVRSGWAILRSEVQRFGQSEDIVVTDESERTRAIARGEQWIRNAGIHFDRQEEVADELFGDFGFMRRWAEDDLVRQRLLTLWSKERPRGEKVEVEAEERARAWVASREALKKPKTKYEPPPF